MRYKVIRGFFKKEIPQTIRDKKMAAVIFALPIVQLILFGFALTNEVKNISVHAVYEPGDYLMSRVEEKLIASKWFKKADVGGENDYIKILTQKKAEAVLAAANKNLAAALEKGNAEIQLLIDATNAQRAMQIETYVKAIANDTIKEHYKTLREFPIKTNIKILYNPSMQSSYFMIPALMGFALCILTILITGMSLAKEKEQGTFEKLISSPISVIELIAGKTLPYALISFIVAPVMLFTGVILFDMPLAGGVFKVFLVCFIFIISSCSVAIFISTLAKTQQQSMMGSLIFLFPSLLLSGLMFPIENIPVLIRWIAYINPLYYLASLLRNIMLKGGDWAFMLKDCSALFIIGLVLAFISVKRFNSKIN
jgi:ABC-2 type transport system permease protein